MVKSIIFKRIAGIVLAVVLGLTGSAAVFADELKDENQNEVQTEVLEREDESLPLYGRVADGADFSSLDAEDAVSLASLPCMNEFFGFTRSDLVSYLEYCEATGYYLSTPYQNMDPVPGVGMQCSGFVWHVLDSVAKQNHEWVPCSSVRVGLSPTWTEMINHFGEVQTYYFYTIEEMLSSGVMEKGDVIWCYSDLSQPGADYHIGIFYGDYPSDDKFWHSSGYAWTEVYAGTPRMNRISRIEPCQPYNSTGFRVFKMSGEAHPKPENEGWNDLYGKRYYVKDGRIYTGLQEIDGCLYVFDEEGVLYTGAGTPLVNGKKYWTDSNGVPQTGWLQLGSWKLYFDPVTYEAAVGLKEIDGVKYAFADNGILQKIYEDTVGPVYENDHYVLYDANSNIITKSGTPLVWGGKYWVGPDGFLHSGWLKLGNWKMYFNPETFTASTGLTSVGDKVYMFNNDGVMQTYAGTPVINGKKYWFSTDDASLKTGWLNLGSWRMYFDPIDYTAVANTTRTIDGVKYIFNNDGIVVGTK